MLVSLTDVKDYLGITGSASDTRLQAILDECEGFILSYLGDITIGTKTERVEKSRIIYPSTATSHNLLPFKIWKVTAINTINGTDFTSKVNGVDYVINPDGTAEVKNLLDYVLSGDFSSFLISYQAGYSTTPDELIGAVSEYVGLVYASQYGREVTREQLWPRSVEYSDTTGADGKPESPKDRLALILKRYMPLHLRIW